MNLDIYTTEMAKSVWDKAFFMDKIPGVKCVIDFGCADGAMIRFLAPLFPEIEFIGYDINEVLIEKAQKSSPTYDNIVFFHGISSVYTYMKGIKHYQPEEICINFSSVLHEVFSSTGGIDCIQYLVNELKPRYITIRDMYCDDTIDIRKSEDITYILDNIVAHFGLRVKEKYFREYAKECGPISTWRDFTHLLMKLQWIDNGWDDELKENYFSWIIGDIITMCPNYSPVFECRYQLPYLSEKWRKDFNWYNPDMHTHAQFILRRDD